jgi:hypothetical protein
VWDFFVPSRNLVAKLMLIKKLGKWETQRL